MVLTYLNAVTGISVGYYLIYADTAQNFNPQLQGALLRIFIKPIFQPRISFSVYSNPYTFPHHRFMVRKFSYNRKIFCWYNINIRVIYSRFTISNDSSKMQICQYEFLWKLYFLSLLRHNFDFLTVQAIWKTFFFNLGTWKCAD